MKTDLKIENLKFVDFPQQLSLQEYIKNKREFVGYFKCHPAVRAIYEIGSINNPGISDLDLILVLRDKGVLESSDYEFLNKLQNSIFIHSPFVISDSLFSYINYIFYASNMHKLAGKTYKFLQPTSNSQHNQLAWLICAEAAVGRLGDIVYQITLREQVSLRKLLLKLNSIKHNINLLRKVDENGDRNEWKEFIKQISELRKTWFLLQKEKQIERACLCLDRGVLVLLEIIDYLSSLSEKIFHFTLTSKKENGNRCFILPNSFQIIKFEPSEKSRIKTIANPLSIMRRMRGNNKQKIMKHINDFSIIILPSELSFLFLPDSSLGTDVKKLSKKSFVFRGKENSLLRKQNINFDLVRLRLSLFDEYNEFIKKNGLSRMSFLLMGTWQLDRKVKFFDLKKNILRGMVRLGIA